MHSFSFRRSVPSASIRKSDSGPEQSSLAEPTFQPRTRHYIKNKINDQPFRRMTNTKQGTAAAISRTPD